MRDGLAHQGVGSGPADYAVAGYSHADARLARIEGGAYVVWNLGDRYWEFDGDAQFAWSAGGVLRSTGRRKALSDPMSLLHAGVAYGGRDTYRIARADCSEIVFHAAETPVPGEWAPISGFTLTADAVTLRVLGFQVTRALRRELPAAIGRDRHRLRTAATDSGRDIRTLRSRFASQVVSSASVQIEAATATESA